MFIVITQSGICCNKIFHWFISCRIRKGLTNEKPVTESKIKKKNWSTVLSQNIIKRLEIIDSNFPLEKVIITIHIFKLDTLCITNTIWTLAL